MTDGTPTRFSDGKAYERSMGRWSRKVGEIFLDWLDLPPGLRWIDVACGNGAFTALLIQRCDPSDVQGIDVSDGQLAFARERLAGQPATFQEGDAQALPFADGEFDAAMMALAINLVPDRGKAVAEMARVVRPVGWVGTYMWDINGGGFPMEPIRKALREMGSETRFFGTEFTEQQNMRELWKTAGLEAVEARRIEIEVTFDDFDDYWISNTHTEGTVPNAINALSESEVESLKDRLRASLPSGARGQIAYTAHANAVKGRVSA
jgi:ubiquinone/menaquinone biosynthesis C-methylase UbiE